MAPRGLSERNAAQRVDKHQLKTLVSTGSKCRSTPAAACEFDESIAGHAAVQPALRAPSVTCT
jgi:hypothetical protein